MKGISFPEQTVVFGKPENWKDEDCYGLPINQGFYLDSEGKPQPCLRSVWELTDADIDYVVKHKKVYLRTSGVGMPPVSIHVLNEMPFEESEVIKGLIFHTTGQFIENVYELKNYQEWVNHLHEKQRLWAELKNKPDEKESDNNS